MQIEFLSKFSKDINNISQKTVKTNLHKLIQLIEVEKDLTHIPNLKKLVGHKTAYRIRIGDYRVGFFYEYKTVIFARIVHRKDIYKIFP